jgi:protein-disulfide isomerase
MATSRPLPRRRASRLVVVLAFAVAIVAAVGLVLAAVIFRTGSAAPSPTVSPVVDLAGIPQAGDVLGNPAAKVTLIEYADPQCPGCWDF